MVLMFFFPNKFGFSSCNRRVVFSGCCHVFSYHVLAVTTTLIGEGGYPTFEHSGQSPAELVLHYHCLNSIVVLASKKTLALGAAIFP